MYVDALKHIFHNRNMNTISFWISLAIVSIFPKIVTLIDLLYNQFDPCSLGDNCYNWSLWR